ncbi:MAG: AAA family ATPase [Rikenellaceae bacterium]
MILKELRINNFRSYYKESLFTFKDGLTLIIGGNGDGKTTFFDALDWLFITARDNKSETLISEKRKSEMIAGESDCVSVSLVFEHDGEKSIEKKFYFEKSGDGSFMTSDYSFQGWEGTGSEREMIKGGALLERCFDTVIRKYCLFKGESQLDVFNDEMALKTLVNTFSDIRQFDAYVDSLKSFEANSDKAYKKELKSDEKTTKKVERLEQMLKDVNHRIGNVRQDIKQQEAANSGFQTKIDDIEQYKESSEKYNQIRSRIATLEDKLSRAKSMIDERYSIKLLDELWVLMLFPDIFTEYRKKVADFGKQKRKLDREFIEKRAKEKGKQEAIEEMTAIANGAVPLSNFVPDGETMQEMIDEHICKVCNRVAEEGSDAHNFMKEKLALYLKSIEAKHKEEQEEDEKQLFVKSHIEELQNINVTLGGSNIAEIANLKTTISDFIDFNASRKKQVEEITEQLKEAQDEKSRLLMQSNNVSEELLAASFTDIKGLFEQKERAGRRLSKLKDDLNELLEEKRGIDAEFAELNPKTGMANLYSKVHTTFEKILKAFIEAKNSNLRRFLADLEMRANDYLTLLNVDDFHGIVRIVETVNESARIQLYSSNGSIINDPNGALKTTMYMSVLFAISDLTSLKREEDYPLIFDAPTSSFESFKEEEFYNVIDKINKQCIIVTKDLLDKDEATGTRKLNESKIAALTCSVYRIEKQRPFVSTDLSTICTTSTPIK